LMMDDWSITPAALSLFDLAKFLQLIALSLFDALPTSPRLQ
jgi:hypothetical protein